jgi:hypothetical protein
MNTFMKRLLLILGPIVVLAFIGFLYFIPPFLLAPPEDFSKPEADAARNLEGMTDPAARLIAERGKYLVTTIGCTGCHTPGGSKGPKFDTEYLAGGMKLTDPNYGTVVSRNLTPDPTTGLNRRTDEQVMRTLRSGVFAETGRIFSPFLMPWAEFSNLTEEDRYAIVVYLRQLHPVMHTIPDFVATSDQSVMSVFGGDYANHGGH